MLQAIVLLSSSVASHSCTFCNSIQHYAKFLSNTKHFQLEGGPAPSPFQGEGWGEVLLGNVHQLKYE